MYIPDCAIRAISQGIKMPYVDVCKRLGVSYKKGHGLIRNSGIYLKRIETMFDEYFDIVVDFDDTLPPDEIPEMEFDTTTLFDDEPETLEKSNEMNLEQWMRINVGTGRYLVALHSPENSSGHIVYVNTMAMKFFDIWDCSKWKVDAWMRIKDENMPSN
jgi:hypothetical protein